MGTGYHGGFGNTAGAKPDGSIYLPVGQLKLEPFFTNAPQKVSTSDNSDSMLGIGGGGGTTPKRRDDEPIMMQIMQVYLAMYDALAVRYSVNPTIVLNNFLDAANPYANTEYRSVDPKIQQLFILFAESMAPRKQMTVQIAYRVVTGFLEKNTSFVEEFKRISPEKWLQICKKVIRKSSKVASRG